MSKKQELNKSKMKKLIDEQNGVNPDVVTDEDFEVFMKAFFGPYKGGGYNPE